MPPLWRTQLRSYSLPPAAQPRSDHELLGLEAERDGPVLEAVDAAPDALEARAVPPQTISCEHEVDGVIHVRIELRNLRVIMQRRNKAGLPLYILTSLLTVG